MNRGKLFANPVVDSPRFRSRGFAFYRDNVGLMKKLSLVIVLAALNWRCASIAAPGGGPEDKTPPSVLANTPVNDSVRVGRSTRITLQFSETMNRESVERAVFISPPPSVEPEWSWHKNILTIQLPDSLPENRTCVVTIGTEAVDIHANPLARAYTFAFSTGDSIDKGKISGQVVTEVKAAVAVLAYRLNGSTDPDSEVYQRKADYVTQTDARGLYDLPYLAAGRYRLYGLLDQDEDDRYTKGIDLIGLTHADVTLSDSNPRALRMDMHLMLEDTARFDAIDAIPFNPNTIGVAFNRTLPSKRWTEYDTSFSPISAHFGLTDSTTLTPVTIRDAFFNTKNRSDFRFLVDPLDTGHTYVMNVDHLVSDNGDTLAATQVRLQAVQGFDSGRAAVEWLLPEGASPDNILPEEPLVFRFDKGMNRPSVENGFSVTDSSGVTVPGVFRWLNSSSMTFRPQRNYASLMPYTIRMDDSIRDWEGLRLSDTTIVLRFRSFKTDSLGSVTGRLEDDHPFARGPFVVTCRGLNVGSRALSADVAGPGAFEFKYVPPGRYVISAFRDEDGNGAYSAGRTMPLIFSERFSAFPDTVVVRPNWETSNVIIRFLK